MEDGKNNKAIESDNIEISRHKAAEKYRDVYSLSQYIMAWSYIENGQYFILSDGSIMKCYEFLMAPTSSMSDAALRAMSDSISNSLSRLPANTIIQSIIAPSIDINDDISLYKKGGGGGHPFFDAIEMRKVDFFLFTRREPMFQWRGAMSSYMTRRLRGVLCIIIVPTESAGGLWASFCDALESLRLQFLSFLGKSARRKQFTEETYNSPAFKRFVALKQQLCEQAESAALTLCSALEARGVSLQPLSASSYIALLRSLIYPTSSSDNKAWDPSVPISHQIGITDVVANFAEGYVKAGFVYHKCLTLSSLPKYSYPGYFTRPQTSFSGLTLLDSLHRGFLSISGIVLDRKEVRLYLERRARFVNGGFAVKERRPFLLSDINLAHSKIEGQGRNVFMGQITISCWEMSPDEARKSAEKIRERLEQIDLRMRTEVHHAPSLWLQSLPGNYAPSLPESRRLHWIIDDTMADFLPFYGMSRGTKRSRFMAHNRLGEPVHIDLFDGAAPHGVVIGASGSGKSFFINNFVADFLRAPNTQAFFIDKGRSYETMTSLLGDDGQFSVFGLKSRTCINPCAGTLSQASSFLQAFIAYLVTQSKERDQLTAYQVGLLAKAINTAFERKQKTGLPYNGSYADAKKTYQGYYFHKIYKRFIIQRLDRSEIAMIERAKSAESSRTPEFTIYYAARLHGRDRHVGWERAADVPQDVVEWFSSRQAEITDEVSGVNGVCIIYRQDSLELSMDREKIIYEPLQDIMILECQREDDLAIAVSAGVTVKYPEEFLEHYRNKIEEQVRSNPLYASASKQAIDEYVAMQMAEIPPQELFIWSNGCITTQGEVFLSDIQRELANYGDPEAESIASRLLPYVGNGIYAGFFDGKTEFHIHGKKIVCWETEELASAGEHLLGAIVGSLLQNIILYGQTDEGRGIQKIVILEEFWQLLAVDMISLQVINMYRTARKFNTGVLCVSQLITDFTNTNAGKQIIDQANFRFVLMQPANVVAESQQTLKLTPEQVELLSSVVSQRGLFSEIMYLRGDTGECDVMRLVPNPFFYWVATTHPQEAKLRERRIKEMALEIKDRKEATRIAIMRLADEYPHGLEHGKRAS